MTTEIGMMVDIIEAMTVRMDMKVAITFYADGKLRTVEFMKR